MATTYLYKTPSSTGSNTISTFSGWIKKTANGAYQGIFTSVYEAGEYFQINFESGNDSLEVRAKVSSSYVLRKITTRRFRDNAAFYHIVVAIDTTDATAEDRCKIYVNGVRETSFSTNTNPSQNQDLKMNTAGSYQQRIGRSESSSYYEGLMAHVHWVDGTAYQASTFGETDSTSGIWKPKASPTGITYGTNGFFLKFENSGAMGTDSSGNSNTFTVSGTLTQIIDTPSNNFATLNPAPSVEIGSSAFYEYGGTNVRSSTSNWVAGVSGIYLNQGKWYFEMQPGSTTDAEFGIAGENKIQNGGTSGGVNGRLFYYEDTTGYAYAYSASNGQIYFSTPSDGTQTASYGNSFGTSDVVGCFADLDNNKLYFSKNGTIQNSGTGYSIQSGIYYAFGANSYNANTSLNFGNGTFKGVKLTGTTYADANGEGIFKYSPNQGGASNFDSAAKNFYAINTKNIKEFG